MPKNLFPTRNVYNGEGDDDATDFNNSNGQSFNIDIVSDLVNMKTLIKPVPSTPISE